MDYFTKGSIVNETERCQILFADFEKSIMVVEWVSEEWKPEYNRYMVIRDRELMCFMYFYVACISPSTMDGRTVMHSVFFLMHFFRVVIEKNIFDSVVSATTSMQIAVPINTGVVEEVAYYCYYQAIVLNKWSLDSMLLNNKVSNNKKLQCFLGFTNEIFPLDDLASKPHNLEHPSSMLLTELRCIVSAEIIKTPVHATPRAGERNCDYENAAILYMSAGNTDCKNLNCHLCYMRRKYEKHLDILKDVEAHFPLIKSVYYRSNNKRIVFRFDDDVEAMVTAFKEKLCSGLDIPPIKQIPFALQAKLKSM